MAKSVSKISHSKAADKSVENKAPVRKNQERPRLIKNESEANLDFLIHERTRLALVSALAANDKMSFNDIKGLLNISDGNLSAHARKLEDADYLSCSKGFQGRIPRTEYQLTAKGRQALQKYVTHMEALIKAMKKNC